MVLAAYLALISSIVVWTRNRAWILGASRRTLRAGRLGAIAVALIVAAVGVLVIGQSENDEFLPLLTGIALFGAASLLALGVALGDSRIARALRISGWLMAVAVLCIPSTLTVLLLLVAPIIFLLGDLRSWGASAERGQARAG